MMDGLKREGLFYAAILLACVSAWSAERPPQHPELRRAINLGKYDQAREYIKQGAEEIYCGDMPADSAKAVWDKRWKKEPYHALRGCLRQYTSFYPEKACQSKWSSPEICAGRLKDSASLADPKRFYALASAALDDSEYKTLLKDEIALLGEGRLMALADDAGFDFARDSVLPENMNAWTGMLRDLQRKFKLFGNGEKGFYPGSEEWTASPRLQASVEAHKAAKVAKAEADSAHAAIWERVARRGESRSQPEESAVHILKIVEVVDYTPTGRRIVVYSNGAPTTPQFTGKEMDAETGLYHFGARQYDPELALWAQVDPGRQFASPYVYAGNGMNPIVARDDDGRKLRFSDDVSGNFRAEFARAIAYMNAAGVSGIFARLEALPETITITNTLKCCGETEVREYGYRRLAIHWNPYTALKLIPSGTQSPALQLFHEAYHVEDMLSDWENRYLGKDEFVPDYENPKEEAVISGPETWAAKKLGEDYRTNHFGTYFLVEHSDER